MINEVHMTTAMAQSKSMLAKLLATEDITVRQNANAKTASFNVKDRILEMPVWKGISEDLADMLTVHETGHALDTPCDGWLDAIKSIAEKHHEKPTQRHSAAVKGFLNVIEDARIDKRQKRRYPGSRRNYLAGYKELIERGFFGPPSTDWNTYNFIDRLNIYFKGGFATIRFAPDEMPWVKRVENAETFAEVLDLTDQIYAFCKAKGEQEQRQTPDDVEYTEEDGEGDFDGDFDGDFEDMEDDDGGDGQDSERGEGDADDESEGKSVKSENDLDQPGSSGGQTEEDDFVPESQTDNTWQEKQELLADNDSEYVYLTIPKPNIANIVDDYKVFLAENENYNNQMFDFSYLSTVAKSFQTFKQDENNSISFMVKEFEMKKSADMYAKISIAKTGVIDTNKLHSYKYNDDIFRRLATMPKGKNHGFILFMDWSGSMTTELKGTLKQLLSMVLFCKRVQIPFEVYIFRDLNKNETSMHNMNSFSREQSEDFFEFQKGDMALGAFKLRNVLSSRMSLAELNRAFNIMWGFTTNNHSNVEPLSGTPLNQAIIAATELVKQFRERNKLQIVNTIFLTDGGSNPILGYVGQPAEPFYIRHQTRRRYVVQDSVTKKEYFLTNNRIDGDEITNSLLRSLKDRTGCNLIGFYLFSSWGRFGVQQVYGTFFPNSNNDKHREMMIKSWRDNKFMPVTSAGYDEYFVINAAAMKDTSSDLRVDSNMTKSKIAKEFLSFSTKKSVNRILLQRFINLVATAKVA